MRKSRLSTFIITVCMGIIPYTSIASEAPKLILQITVDQLRSDLLKRYMSKMGEGGFKYLYTQGIVYENAHHAHSNTETIVGGILLWLQGHILLVMGLSVRVYALLFFKR